MFSWNFHLSFTLVLGLLVGTITMFSSPPADAQVPNLGQERVRRVPGGAIIERPRLQVRSPGSIIELANGMRLLLVESPKASFTRLGWVVPSGSASDPEGQTGLAHLVEHLMFQGSETIGGSDFEREGELLRREDQLLDKLELLGSSKRVEHQLADVRQELSALTRFGDFSTLYAKAGAVGLDAVTYEDLTLYVVALPAEAIELWFWLESNRLLEPVFRQFERERAVVREERRHRVDAVPGGRFAERVRASFWAGTPYESPGLGTTESLAGLRRADARAFFQQHYQPDRLTAIVIGPHRSHELQQLATRYFGRLQNRPDAPVSSRTISLSRELREHQINGSGPGRSHWQFLYPTVPYDHPDVPALDLLAALLNGQNGRLNRQLVKEKQLATVAQAVHHPRRLAGSFTLTAEPSADLDALKVALDAEIERLIREPVSTTELESTRRRLIYDHYRQFKNPLTLLKQHLIHAGLGDDRGLNERWSGVWAGDLQRVARTYLTPEKRLVARYEGEPASATGAEP